MDERENCGIIGLHLNVLRDSLDKVDLGLEKDCICNHSRVFVRVEEVVGSWVAIAPSFHHGQMHGELVTLLPPITRHS